MKTINVVVVLTDEAAQAYQKQLDILTGDSIEVDIVTQVRDSLVELFDNIVIHDLDNLNEHILVSQGTI